MAETPSACQRVFAITELAEKIFLELDFTTLLTKVQRTCRQWHAVVQDSGPLQELLFFKPISPTLVYVFRRRPLNVSDAQWDDIYFAESKHERETACVLMHPLLHKEDDTPIRQYSATDGPWDIISPAMRRPEASWRRPLVSQPPLGKLFGSCPTAEGLKTGIMDGAGYALRMDSFERAFSLEWGQFYYNMWFQGMSQMCNWQSNFEFFWVKENLFATEPKRLNLSDESKFCESVFRRLVLLRLVDLPFDLGSRPDKTWNKRMKEIRAGRRGMGG